MFCIGNSMQTSAINSMCLSPLMSCHKFGNCIIIWRTVSHCISVALFFWASGDAIPDTLLALSRRSLAIALYRSRRSRIRYPPDLFAPFYQITHSACTLSLLIAFQLCTHYSPHSRVDSSLSILPHYRQPSTHKGTASLNFAYDSAIYVRTILKHYAPRCGKVTNSRKATHS